jgi:lipopolysaccharide transport system ATP-binding protein/teichoic acid transport system ATP-binding protein
MFARLAFAVAISVEPEILIVDETLSVGDMRFQIKCMDRMKAMMENGTTILYVSHDTNSVRRFCQQALWINNGELKAMGEVNQITDQYEDFLRGLEAKEKQTEIQENQTEDDTPAFVQVQDGSIAKVVQIRVRDDMGRDTNVINYATPVEVQVEYDVYDTKVIDPVLGVALFRADDDYVCGLNTLLDNVRIPWKYGRNRFSIHYSQGLRVLGGQYYFDVALRDQTATVNIDYKSRVRDIQVNSGYLAEGRLILPHYWGVFQKGVGTDE